MCLSLFSKQFQTTKSHKMNNSSKIHARTRAKKIDNGNDGFMRYEKWDNAIPSQRFQLCHLFAAVILSGFWFAWDISTHINIKNGISHLARVFMIWDFLQPERIFLFLRADRSKLQISPVRFSSTLDDGSISRFIDCSVSRFQMAQFTRWK